MKAEYEKIIGEETAKINEFLKSCPLLEISGSDPAELVIEAESYALSAGGKRIRPLLAVEFYKLFSQKSDVPDYVYKAACALEMTHTFSLIHDDMPEMDDDDLRRGRPATHVAFGADVGLLAGDGLAILPYQLISSLSIDRRISAETAVKLINLLSESAGNRGMIAGQMLDLWSEDRTDGIDEAFLRKMSDLKTGCILRASCIFGAILADAGEEELKSAEFYAKNVGLAFQIVDDVLDVTSNDEDLGKPVGSDKDRKKATFADILGVDGALSEAMRLSAAAADRLLEYPGSGLLRELAISLAERKK